MRVIELGPQSREVEVLIQQLQAWNAIGVEWQNMAVLARQHDILHQLRASCELLDIPVRHQLSGGSLRRLVHVRECWRLLEQLRELETQPINQQQMLAMLSPSESATSNGTMRPPLLNRWNHLLRGVINGCWNGLSPEVPVPALQLRSELMDALFEVGREFSLGTGVFLGTVHAAKGLEFDRVLLPSRGWDRALETAGEREEERRLFYVGCTRPRHELVVLAGRTHALARELYGDQVIAVPTPESRTLLKLPNEVRYKVLELGDIHLGYPSHFAAAHRIHQEIAQTQAGDNVELRLSNDKVVIFARGQKIGMLSTKASEEWKNLLGDIERATVIAFVARFADQGTVPGGLPPQVAQWEVPIIELKFYQSRA